MTASPPPAQPAAGRRRPLAFGDAVVVLLLPALAAVALATFAAAHPWCDLCANFPMHSMLALLVGSALLAGLRRWVWVAAFALGALLAAARLLPQTSSRGPEPAAADARTVAGAGAPLRAAFANLRGDAARVDDVLRWAAAENPEVLGLAEVTPNLWRQLEPLRQRLPHTAAQPEVGCFGIALLSRHPLTRHRIVPLGPGGTPAIVGTAAHPTGPIGLLVAHPPPPIFGGPRADRDGGLRALPGLLAPLPARRVLLGDLNATPWTAPFRALLADAGLVDTSRDQGYPGSWPLPLPRWLRIPIDHVLVSRGLGVQGYRLGPDLGSDHLPVVVDLRLPTAPPRRRGETR